MSEPFDPRDDDTDADARFERPEPSGLESVDRVVEAVATLEGRPLDEQVAGLESAHAALRAALDDPGPASVQPPRPASARTPGG